MAYTNINFKTKKALKEAVQNYISYSDLALDKAVKDHMENAKPVRCHQPGLGPDLTNFTGMVALEGPHYPAAHTWYASAELKDGIVIKVK